MADIKHWDEITLADIDFSKARSSYSGAAGKCCCGCAGNHSTSPIAIKRQINRIKKLEAEGHEVDFGGSYVAVERGNRLYIVYFENEDSLSA